MDFKKINPVTAGLAPTTPQASDTPHAADGDAAANTIAPLQFVVTLIPDTRDRAARPNRLNALYIRLIGLLLLIIPVPLGSHRPVPWALWALVVSGLVLAFVIRLLVSEPDRKLRSLAHRDLLLIALVMPLFAAAQLLPLGHLVPGAFPPELAPDTITLSASATLLALLRLMTYAGLFVLTLEVCTRPERVRQLAQIIFYGLTAHAIIAMISLNILGDRFLWGEKTTYLGWATGTFVNRNSFASFMGLGIITGLALLMAHRQNAPRPRRSAQLSLFSPQAVTTGGYWVCLSLMATALVASGSRMGVTATVTGAAITLICMSAFATPPSRNAPSTRGHHRSRTRPRARLWRTGIVSLVIVAALAMVLLSQNIGERLIFSAGDLASRLALYHAVWDLILTRPWTGYGLDTFQLAFPLVHDERVSSAYIWDLTHNSYLMLWVELGLIAGSAPLIALAGAALRLIRTLRRAAGTDPDTGPAIAIALGALGLAATHSLLDFSFEIEANTVLLVVMIAMGLSQTKRTKGTPS